MLKVKKDVDLNILIEKYDFKPKYNPETGELVELYRIQGRYIGETERRRKSATITWQQNFDNQHLGGRFKDFWQIFLPSRRFTNYNPASNRCLTLDNDDYEILYDLITAGIVVKE